MAFDAVFLSAALGEARALEAVRVEKIHQPARDTVILHLRHSRGRARLLIAACPAAPRLHLTAANPENPAEPPMFCMLLRKHLLGARLTGIRQTPMERCAEFLFDCTDELGDHVEKRLVCELMGRTCNIYLLASDGRILDCLRRVGLGESVRPALPGLKYQPPEPLDKRDPLLLGAPDYAALLSEPGADVLAQRLMDRLGGLSPLVCREAALYAAGDADARVSALDRDAAAAALALFFAEHLNHPAPYYYAPEGGVPKQYAFCPLRQYGQSQTAPSFGELLDLFYTQRDLAERMRQKGQTVRKTIKNLCERTQRKLAIQEKELEATRGRERTRQLGDIVTANLHRIARGQTVLEAEDFYDPDMKTISVPLLPSLSPQQNAAKFYKDYARMKNAERELTRQLALGREELAYLQSVLEELERARSEAELDEIRQELRAGGYLKADSARKKPRQARLKPMAFTSTDGYPIYVGRNNLQNDALTFGSARRDDIWCHASKVHGAHVIIACGGTVPPDDTVTQAAQLAAYYAETAGGSNVPVDVTPVRQVKKLSGGRPGMVIYHSYRTVVVNPYPDIVRDRLNAQKKES